MSSEIEGVLDRAAAALIAMQAGRIAECSQELESLRTPVLSRGLEPKLRHLRAAAARSAELWQLYSTSAAGTGYSNDGHSIPNPEHTGIFVRG